MPPAFFLDQPKRLYYAALVALGARLRRDSVRSRRTPFGMALQGVRDDPVRMASLGFNVQLHRTLAFTLAGFVAGVAGVLNIWWNGQIDPNSIGIGPTLDLFIIAVIGGIMHLEGAWLGALRVRRRQHLPARHPARRSPRRSFEDRLLAAERFNTVIGVLLLVIMVVSPDGLAGIIVRARNALSHSAGRGSATVALDAPPTRSDATWPSTVSPGQPPVGP